MTMLGSFGGGTWSTMYSLFKNNGSVDILDLINGILASLVSVTAGCFLYHAWEAILVGMIGAILVSFLTPMFDKMGVDDPVGASSVHGLGGIWGVIGEKSCDNDRTVFNFLLTAVGLFADNPIPLETTNGRMGLFKGGGWYLLGIQCLSALCLLCWVRTDHFHLTIITKIFPTTGSVLNGATAMVNQ